MIPASEVCELLIKIHYILGNDVSKGICNSACILAHIFNSASGHCHEVWASQFPFLHHLKDMVPTIETCLYGHMNWCLAQAQQQSSMGLSQSFLHMGGGKARPRTEFHFNVQKETSARVKWCLFTKRPHLESSTEAHPGGRKSTGGSVSTSSIDSRNKGVCGVGIPDVLQSTASYHLLLLLCRLECFLIFWINGRTLLLTCFCLISFRVTIFSLGLILLCSISSSCSILRMVPIIIKCHYFILQDPLVI